MFAYMRYVYIVSFALAVAGAIALGVVIKQQNTETLQNMTIQRLSIVSQAYVNSVWRKYYLNTSAGGTASAFETETRTFFKDLALTKATVYDVNGKARLTTSGTKIADTMSNQPPYLFGLNVAKAGQIYGRTLEKAQTTSSAGTNNVALVQVLVPVRNLLYVAGAPECAAQATAATTQASRCNMIEGVVELFVDVSQAHKAFDKQQWGVIGSMIGTFLVLLGILFLTFRRAEAIISKQHEANLELIAAAANAESENRDKSQFLANISHELRTPLNAIIGFSEIIKKEGATQMQASHQEYIRDINSAGVHLLSLINDILDFSKAEAGKLEMDLAEVDASKLIRNSMRLVIPRAETAQVTLVEELPTDPIVMITDAKKLKQVLLNLLSNSVKFTPPGGEVRVSAWEQVLDGNICIQVKDTGIGIAPKDISRVMTPFGQADNTLARKYEGTGLGLPLSKKFVELLGGSFAIESEVNVGTTITIRLPKQHHHTKKGQEHVQA